MAQKETSSKSRRWLGLSGAAVLVANLVLTGTTIAFQQEGEVNHALGIEGAGASYGGTEFSADGTLSDASYEKYIEAAYQFCEQEEEEGSVLLYNRTMPCRFPSLSATSRSLAAAASTRCSAARQAVPPQTRITRKPPLTPCRMPAST